MTAVSIKEAKAKLSELIHKLKPGDEVIITDKNVPVARLIPTATVPAQRKLGNLRGTVKYMAPDFDAPLDDSTSTQSEAARRCSHRDLGGG
jgi:prevent-host-death family protein